MSEAATGPVPDPRSLMVRLRPLTLDPYLHIVEDRLRILTVFDDLKYDRADADMMSPAMRQHAITKLGRLGFRQTAGTVLTDRDTGARILIPKFHALGASPFDITSFTPRGAEDWYLLTPTQTACQIIDHYPHEEAVDLTKKLIEKHPINLYRLMDYLEGKTAHRDFQNAIGHLKFVQRTAVESEPLRRRRALG